MLILKNYLEVQNDCTRASKANTISITNICLDIVKIITTVVLYRADYAIDRLSNSPMLDSG